MTPAEATPSSEPPRGAEATPSGERPRGAEVPRSSEPPRVLLILMRVVLPVTIFLIGVVLVIMGHGHYTSVFANRDSLLSAVGVGFWLIAACIWMLNWMMQMNADDAGDRQKEEDARAYFVRNGHWPGEGPAN